MRMKKIAALTLSLVMCMSVVGCGTKKEESSEESAAPVSTIQAGSDNENQQNDYRGGVMRTLTLKNMILDVMDGMKQNNGVVRSENPNSYWTTDGYQDFVSTLLDNSIIEDTQWFNEEETDWDTILSQYRSQTGKFSDGENLTCTITRNEKDDYSISGVAGTWENITSGYYDYRMLYDCDKDWCKAYQETDVNSSYTVMPEITTQMFEYARINNDTFAIQTSRERLLVVLNPADSDTLISGRTIKEFYYSKLTQDGQRTTFTPYEELEEKDSRGEIIVENEAKNKEFQQWGVLNENGDIATMYGVNDSMFLGAVNNMNYDWVFEDKDLQQGFVYKDGILIVTTYNKLSTDYERFEYSLVGSDDALIPQLESIVQLKELVGEQEIKTKKAEEKQTEDSSETETGEDAQPADTTETEATDSEG